MQRSLSIKKQTILMAYGLSENQAAKLVTGGLILQNSGGPDMGTYWNDPKVFNIRDEFFLVVNSHLVFLRLINDIDVADIEDWLGQFQVAYLYQLKLNAQSANSIDVLVSRNCYADAFAICRAIQSRVNLLLVCSLVPELFDHWLKKPDAPQYKEGQIRKELVSHGINPMDHVYRLASEIIHGHQLAHGDIGYFEKGLFADLPQVRHQIYVISKFLLATSTYALIQATLIGVKPSANLDDTRDMDQIYEYFFKSILAHNRLDQIWHMIAEDRHWKQIGTNHYNVGGTYDYARLKELIQKFHQKGDNSKKLGKKYQLENGDG
jgi:hypothetical protein